MTSNLSHSHLSALRTNSRLPMVLDKHGRPVASLATVLLHMQAYDLDVAEVLGDVADPDYDWDPDPT